MKVSVSILSEINNYKEAIKKVNNTNADFLHLDIMDSTFTERSTFCIDDFSELKNINSKSLDIHIMSTNLDERIKEYINLKPEYITFHVETDNVLKHINMIKEKNIKVGLAINPETDIEKVYPYLELVDLILVMSVKPGKGGQSFMSETICKMQELKEISDRYNFIIEVDGGIDDKTVEYVKNYVDVVVSGSYITNSNDYQENINNLKK